MEQSTQLNPQLSSNKIQGPIMKNTKNIAMTSWILLALSSGAVAAEPEKETPPIEDNSFLIEEAYNQDTGIYQHIQYLRLNKNNDWEYNFTEEMPLSGRKHQLSFGVTVLHPEATADFEATTGIGDIAVNYRYELIGQDHFKMTPRFSVYLPTGNSQKGRGDGVVAYDIMIPTTHILSDAWVMHGNLGAHFTFASADLFETIYGASLIYTQNRTLNGMLEVIGKTSANESELTLNPGFRFALNLDSGMQIVPGFSVPIGIGPSSGQVGAFFYLSIEK